MKHPCHLECVGAVDRLVTGGDQICTCAQVLIEYWVVITRPKEVNGFDLRLPQAASYLAKARGTFICLPELPDMADRWERVITEHKVIGRQAHDARLVALMLSHGITHILTLNAADFTRYPEITTLTPAEVLSL